MTQPVVDTVPGLPRACPKGANDWLATTNRYKLPRPSGQLTTAPHLTEAETPHDRPRHSGTKIHIARSAEKLGAAAEVAIQLWPRRGKLDGSLGSTTQDTVSTTKHTRYLQRRRDRRILRRDAAATKTPKLGRRGKLARSQHQRSHAPGT